MVTDFSISSPLFKFLPFPKLESMDSGLKYKKNVQIGGASMAEINTFNIFSLEPRYNENCIVIALKDKVTIICF